MIVIVSESWLYSHPNIIIAHTQQSITYIEIVGHQYLIVYVLFYLHIHSSSPLFCLLSILPSIHPSIIHLSIKSSHPPILHPSIHHSPICLSLLLLFHFIFLSFLPLSFFLSFISPSFLSPFSFLPHPHLSPYFLKKVQEQKEL